MQPPPAQTPAPVPSSLPAAYREHWAGDPDRPTLHDPTEGWVTAAGVGTRVDAAAEQLRRVGVRPGDRVVLSGPTSVAFVVAHLAALESGAVVVPMNVAYERPEVEHILHDAQPTMAIVADERHTAWVRAFRREDGGQVVAAGLELEIETHTVPVPEPARPTLAPLDPALLCYTSGTTGRPKGAVLSHGNLMASARAVGTEWRWTAEDRLLLALPLFHVHGLGVGLHGTLLAGASAVLQPTFDADAALAAIAEHRCTLFFGVPTMYARLVRSERAPALAALRLCVSGSAPLPELLGRQVLEVSGQAVLERYGMTETLMLTTNPYDGPRRLGTVGRPFPEVQLRLSDGDRGEVLVRGPNVFSGYWRNETATRAAFVDGWFRTGDIGELDDDGFLRLVGRSSDLIITGGYNVYPREVEEALADHSDVAEVAVCGVASEAWGESVVAFVVPCGGHDLDDPRALDGLREDLAALAATRLAGYKRPREYRFVAELPRNALGKVVRGALPLIGMGP